LGDVAQEMDNEFEGILALGFGERGVLDSGGVVGDCGYHAGFAAAVGWVVDVAAVGGGVLGVDEVEGGGPCALGLY
jgi:hypothetical protein